MERSLPHEKLVVYEKAQLLIALVDRLALSPDAALSDQVSRSSRSVGANIAEGAGEFSKREKARFYRMALRSATETAAHLDVCRLLNFAKVEQLREGRELIIDIVAMLTTMVRNLTENVALKRGGRAR